jgi:hypothetical protein
LRVGTPVQFVAGMLVAAVVLIGTYWLLLAYVNSCTPPNPYLILGFSILPNLVIGLISIIGRAKAFGLTVIIAGVVFAIAGNGFVFFGCFPSAS